MWGQPPSAVRSSGARTVSSEPACLGRSRTALSVSNPFRRHPPQPSPHPPKPSTADRPPQNALPRQSPPVAHLPHSLASPLHPPGSNLVAQCHPRCHAPATAAHELPASSDPLPDNAPAPPPASHPEIPPPHHCSNAIHGPAVDQQLPPGKLPPSPVPHARPNTEQADLPPNVPTPLRAAYRNHTDGPSAPKTDAPTEYPQTFPAIPRLHFPRAGTPRWPWQFPSPSTPRTSAPNIPDRISPASSRHEGKSPADSAPSPSASANPQTDSHRSRKLAAHQPWAEPTLKCRRKMSSCRSRKLVTVYSHGSSTLGGAALQRCDIHSHSEWALAFDGSATHTLAPQSDPAPPRASLAPCRSPRPPRPISPPPPAGSSATQSAGCRPPPRVLP